MMNIVASLNTKTVKNVFDIFKKNNNEKYYCKDYFLKLL